MRKSGFDPELDSGLIFNIFGLDPELDSGQIDERFEITFQKIFFPADILLSISALIFASV